MDLFVRRRAQTLRMIVSEEKLELLRYSELYVELGILEGRLRVTIPTSLTRKEGVHHPNDWISFITLDERFRNKLKQARIQQRKAGFAASNSIADFLPMSFWSRVISKRHFTSLWIPYVHKISCDFEARQSFKYFQIFEQRLHNATVDRNFVAHFNFSRIDSLSDSLENVRWLQRAMGLVKAE
jgi:hypothetical protein